MENVNITEKKYIQKIWKLLNEKGMVIMAGFFGMFDYTKPGKGVSKEDVNKRGIALFFDILGRRWGKLVLLNLLYVLFSIPALIINWIVIGFILTWVIGFTGGPEVLATRMELSSQDFNLMFQLLNMFLSVLMLMFLGSGSASAASSYVIRKYVNDTHSWVWSDFWDNFKSNFVQGTVCYIINTLVFFISVIAIIFYTVVMNGVAGYVLSAFITVIMIVFLMMQMYVYQIMASFKLKIKDIYRNALMLTLGKLPVNIVAALFAAGIIYIYNLIMHNPLSLLVVITVLFTYTMYIQLFITNNIVNKYLLEPSQKAEDKKNSDSSDEDIFSDEIVSDDKNN